jgi:hypothetical protein
MHRDLVAKGKIDPNAADYDEFLAKACYTDLKAIRSFSEYFSPGVLRLFVMTSIAFFYALSFTFRPQRAVRAVWRIARGRPSLWVERVMYEGIKQYVLRRKISRVATKSLPVPAAAARATLAGLKSAGHPATGPSELRA